MFIFESEDNHNWKYYLFHRLVVDIFPVWWHFLACSVC